MSKNKGEIAVYEFRIVGKLDACWSAWFEGLEIHETVDEDTNLAVTVLIGPVIDPSALHGILEKINSLNLKLLSVNQVRTKAK